MTQPKHWYRSNKRFSVLLALGVVVLAAGIGRWTPHSAFAALSKPSGSVAFVQAQPCPDEYEPDNGASAAGPISLDSNPQQHTLDPALDEDWMKFTVTSGTVVTVTTFNLILDTDTVLRLYDTDGSTLLAYNDDDPLLPEPTASRIIWIAPASGTYFMMVRDYYRRGDCLGYDVKAVASQASAELRRLYVPEIARMATLAPTPTATPSETPTESPTPTVSPTLSETPTPTSTPTETWTPSPSATPTNSPTPSATAVGTPTSTPTITTTPTNTPTGTVTPTSTPSATATPTPTATSSPTPPPPPIIDGIPHPNGIAVNSLTNQIFVASKFTNRLYRIEGANNVVTGNVPTGSQPFGLAVNQTTRKVYVANYAGNSLSIFNGDTGVLLATVNFAALGYGQPAFIAVDEILNRAYVTLHAGDRLAVIDGASNALLTTAETEAGAFGVAVHPGLHRAYVTNRDARNLAIFDTTTNTRIWEQTAASVGEPYAVAVDAVRDRLYILTATNGGYPDRVEVFKLAPSGASRLGTVRVGNGGVAGGTGLAVNSATGRVFVANTADNTMSVLDGPGLYLVATVAVGRDPGMIGVNPNTNLAYVGNRGDDTVQVVVDNFRRRVRRTTP